MTKQEAITRLANIKNKAMLEQDALFQEVFDSRTYQVGDKVRRVLPLYDGSTEIIEGQVVGADTYLYWSEEPQGEHPCVQYWVRIDSPLDYNTKQRCQRYNVELGKAIDFWEGNERWSLVTNQNQ